MQRGTRTENSKSHFCNSTYRIEDLPCQVGARIAGCQAADCAAPQLTSRTNWFAMPPKRQSTDIENTIIKQGCLIKSPPGYLFSNRASWKGRLFKLCKTLTESYYIRYYAFDGVTEKFRGEIAVSDIKSIDLGYNTMEKIFTIIRLFSYSPESVLCIRTSDRDYYLIDENEKNIADWKKCITDVWVKVNKKENADGPRISHSTLVISPPNPTLTRLPDELRDLVVYPIQIRQPALQLVPSQEYRSQALMMDDATRPKSYPEDRPSTDPTLVDMQERPRFHTDPEPRREVPCPPKNQLPFKQPLEKSDRPRASLERERSQTYSDTISAWNSKTEFRRPSESGQSRGSADTAYYSDTESIYDMPRSVAMSVRRSQDSTEEEEEDHSLDSPDKDVYEDMLSLQSSFESETDVTDSTGQLQITPDAEDITPYAEDITPYAEDDLCAEKQNDSVPQKPLRNFKITEQNSEQDSLDYVTIQLTVPTAHLQEHLMLQEVGERLCVSKWKGPVDIGCVFCHGDHITAVNGFRPENKDFFFQMLDRSIKDTVNLVVIRNKKAGVFHVEGCNCERS